MHSTGFNNSRLFYFLLFMVMLLMTLDRFFYLDRFFFLGMSIWFRFISFLSWVVHHVLELCNSLFHAERLGHSVQIGNKYYAKTVNILTYISISNSLKGWFIILFIMKLFYCS